MRTPFFRSNSHFGVRATIVTREQFAQKKLSACSNTSYILWCVYFDNSFNDRNVLLGRVRKAPVGAYGGERVKSSSRLMAEDSLPSEDSGLVDERMAARAFPLFGLVFGMFQAGVG